MGQLSIRGFDKELERCLRRLAKERGISLNKAALLLLRRGAGIEDVSSDRVGDTLDDLIGKWSSEEEREFLERVAVFEQVDENLW
jgi:hypothetical protein